MSSALEPGDVVVTPEVRESHLVYAVRVDGSCDSVAYETRKEATAEALAYAQHAGVNAWYGDRAELGFVLLCLSRESARCERPGAHISE